VVVFIDFVVVVVSKNAFPAPATTRPLGKKKQTIQMSWSTAISGLLPPIASDREFGANAAANTGVFKETISSAFGRGT